jgi:hypothetical protein
MLVHGSLGTNIRGEQPFHTGAISRDSTLAYLYTHIHILHGRVKHVSVSEALTHGNPYIPKHTHIDPLLTGVGGVVGASVGACQQITLCQQEASCNTYDTDMAEH